MVNKTARKKSKEIKDKSSKSKGNGSNGIQKVMSKKRSKQSDSSKDDYVTVPPLQSNLSSQYNTIKPVDSGQAPIQPKTSARKN